MRPKRRRPPRPIPAPPDFTNVLQLVCRSTAAGTGTTEITIQQSLEAPTPWDDPAGALLTFMTDNSLKVVVAKGGSTIIINPDDFTATGVATIETSVGGYTPPDVTLQITDGADFITPRYVPALGGWIDTRQPVPCTLFP